MSTAQAAISKDVSQQTSGLRRYVALDAYRGFIMLILASDGFGFAALKGDPAWGRVASWFDHVPWQGAVFWDMIQPAFMFMVGVAMPFAMARRIENGATWGNNLRHVLGRFVRLILLSQVLICVSRGRIMPQLINVLSQIAFTYLISFFIMRWKWRYQVAQRGRASRVLDGSSVRVSRTRRPVFQNQQCWTCRRPRHFSLRL